MTKKSDDDTTRTGLRALPSPVDPTPSMHPNPPQVDAGKLLAAWNSYHAANLKLIDRFEEAREELKLNREDNRRTRRVAYWVGALVTVAVAASLVMGYRVLEESAEVKAIAKAAGGQLTRVELTLATVVETAAMANEAALEQAVAPVPTPEPSPPPASRRGSQKRPDAGVPEARGDTPIETMNRRLEAQKRAVRVLEKLAESPAAAMEARDRLEVLEEAVQAAQAEPESGGVVTPARP